MDPGERQRLASTPLHEITARLGEAGLRERFAIEVEGRAEHDRQRLGQALELASRLHAADRRLSETYVNHLLRVAIRISGPYQVRDSDVICAALLHDSVEDHAAQLAAAGGQDGALAALGARFGARVADLVGAVTNPGYQPGTDPGPQYRDHVAASLERCPWARVIKVSDFVDNGGSLRYAAGPAVLRLARKYAPLVPVLAHFIARPDTPLRPDVKTLILGQLGRARDDLAEILG